jgi:hypothetical protein
LIHYTRPGTPIYIIDPQMPAITDQENLFKIELPATSGTQVLFDELTMPDAQ